jgi:hypothetical protein
MPHNIEVTGINDSPAASTHIICIFYVSAINTYITKQAVSLLGFPPTLQLKRPLLQTQNAGSTAQSSAFQPRAT